MPGERRGDGAVLDVEVGERPTRAAQGHVDERSRAVVRVVAPAVEHDGPVAVDALRQVRNQARLAGALGADHRYEAARTCRRRLPGGEEPGRLDIASDEGR